MVLDVPVTGHTLAMLGSPRTFAKVARADRLRVAPTRHAHCRPGADCAYLAVAHASEMAVTETIELAAGLRAELGCELAAVIVNQRLPRRFSASEMA